MKNNIAAGVYDLLPLAPGFRSEFDRNSQILRGVWGTQHRFCKGVTEVQKSPATTWICFINILSNLRSGLRELVALRLVCRSWDGVHADRTLPVPEC